MTEHNAPQTSFWQRLLSGNLSLALKYWTLYWIMAVIFFVTGSFAVADRNWQVYLMLLGGVVAWSFILLFGIRRAYQGSDPGKAISRISVLFLLLNLTNALATLSFI